MSKYHFHLFDLAETSLGGRKRTKRKALGQSQIGSAEVEREGSRAEGRTRGLQHGQRVSAGHTAPLISSDIFILLEECKSLNVLGSCLLRDGSALRGPVTVAEDLGFVSRIYMEAHTHLVQES